MSQKHQSNRIGSSCATKQSCICHFLHLATVTATPSTVAAPHLAEPPQCIEDGVPGQLCASEQRASLNDHFPTAASCTSGGIQPKSRTTTLVDTLAPPSRQQIAASAELQLCRNAARWWPTHRLDGHSGSCKGQRRGKRRRQSNNCGSMRPLMFESVTDSAKPAPVLDRCETRAWSSHRPKPAEDPPLTEVSFPTRSRLVLPRQVHNHCVHRVLGGHHDAELVTRVVRMLALPEVATRSLRSGCATSPFQRQQSSRPPEGATPRASSKGSRSMWRMLKHSRAQHYPTPRPPWERGKVAVSLVKCRSETG